MARCLSIQRALRSNGASVIRVVSCAPRTHTSGLVQKLSSDSAQRGSVDDTRYGERVEENHRWPMAKLLYGSFAGVECDVGFCNAQPCRRLAANVVWYFDKKWKETYVDV